MIKCFWCFLLLGVLPSFGISQEQDSIRQRQVSTGVHVLAENISEFVLKGNDGFGFEIGAYQERKVLEKVTFSYEAGVRFKSYIESTNLVDSTRLMLDMVPDTAVIADFYEVRHDDIKFTALASVRFAYLEEPYVYFIIGVGPEFTLNQQVVPDYLNTRFFDEDFVLISDEIRPEPNLDDDEFNKSIINLRFELGLGIELNNKLNIELVHRTDNTQNFGLRIRYVLDTLTY